MATAIWSEVSVMSEEDETNIKFYDYQGSLLKDIDTKQVKCFVSARGFVAFCDDCCMQM